MYSFDSRIRYSEVNQQGVLRTDALINYFQDCSTFQSEDLGVGVAWLTQRNRCWIVNSWQIKVVRYPKLGETIKVYTWPNSLKGILGTRNFKLTDQNGDLLAVANSLWTFFDTEHLRPAKITEDILNRYEMEPEFEADWEGRKITLPQEMEEREPFFVRTNHLDTNYHVNNGQYILMAQTYLPEGFETKELRVEYKKAAVLGDEIFPHVYKEESRIIVSLTDENKRPYAVAEFKAF